MTELCFAAQNLWSSFVLRRWFGSWTTYGVKEFAWRSADHQFLMQPLFNQSVLYILWFVNMGQTEVFLEPVKKEQWCSKTNPTHHIHPVLFLLIDFSTSTPRWWTISFEYHLPHCGESTSVSCSTLSLSPSSTLSSSTEVYFSLPDNLWAVPHKISGCSYHHLPFPWGFFVCSGGWIHTASPRRLQQFTIPIVKLFLPLPLTNLLRFLVCKGDITSRSTNPARTNKVIFARLPNRLLVKVILIAPGSVLQGSVRATNRSTSAL